MKINLVSIIIPAFNEEASIAVTLQSVLDQDYQGDKEIIVVDNASTDKTAQIAKDLDVKVIRESRKGTRFAYQRGMQDSEGEIIITTNADSIVPRDWVSSIINIYEQDPDVVGVGTKVSFYGVSPIINLIFDILYRLNPTKSFWGQSMSCRREAFVKVGGINHGYDTNEDGIFGLLLKKVGKIVFLNNIVVRSSGRRYSGGPIRIIRNWLNGVGGNSIIIQLKYLFTGRIEGNMKTFDDVRDKNSE